MKKVILGVMLCVGLLQANEAREYCEAAYVLKGEKSSYSWGLCSGETDEKYWRCIYREMKNEGETMGYAKGYCFMSN